MRPEFKLFAADEGRRLETYRLLAELLSKYPELSFAYVYGSFTGGGPFRDIDLGLYFRPGEEECFESFLGGEVARLESKTGFPLDVRLLNNAPRTFLFHVFQGKCIFSRDEKRLSDLMERTAREYLDLAPLLRQATKEAFSGGA